MQMQPLAWVASLLLFLVNSASGLKCYACTPNRQIGGVTLPAALQDRMKRYPRCADMKVKDPGLDYELHCPPGLDKSCVKIRDERGNELRSCFAAKASKCAKTSKEGQVFCTCKGDFCNSALTARASVLGVLTATAAALLTRLH